MLVSCKETKLYVAQVCGTLHQFLEVQVRLHSAARTSIALLTSSIQYPFFIFDCIELSLETAFDISKCYQIIKAMKGSRRFTEISHISGVVQFLYWPSEAASCSLFLPLELLWLG
jgi:hypothetical protein